jgi:hypothetical protein
MDPVHRRARLAMGTRGEVDSIHMVIGISPAIGIDARLA